MSLEKYHKLIDELCQFAGIEDPKQQYETAKFKVDGISFALQHAGEDYEDYAMFFCNYGYPPDDYRELVLQRLLEGNTALSGPFAPIYGINYESGNVLLSQFIPIQHATGEGLLKVMRHHAAYALDWQRNYFLLDEERHPGSGKASSGRAADGLPLAFTRKFK